MNVEAFKQHLASRKIHPEPLRTKEIPLELPTHYAVGGDNPAPVLLDACRVLFVDLKKSAQTIILDLGNTSVGTWLQHTFEYDKQDIRLSRFQRAYGGMMNPPIRMWRETKGGYVRWKGNLSIGSIVQCACTPRESKGNLYFDLHRDIVVVEAKTKTVDYFSDEDV